MFEFLRFEYYLHRLAILGITIFAWWFHGLWIALATLFGVVLGTMAVNIAIMKINPVWVLHWWLMMPIRWAWLAGAAWLLWPIR